MNRILGILILFVACAISFAQGTQSTYRLQPEDVLRIQVYKEQDLFAEVPVGKDGNISAPFAGILRAEGKTTAELEAELVTKYIQRLKIKDPRVSVIIVKYRELRASIGGAVNRPGTFPIRSGDTLVTLLTQGGGVISERADLRRSTLRRKNSNELIPVDLYTLLILGDNSQNVDIEDGDELNVPEETRNRILVQGSVRQPGFFPYRDPMTLADAISQAGGEVIRKSRLSKVVILRQNPGNPGTTLQIQADYVRYIKQNDATQNVQLRPGDLVFVPQNNNPDLETISQIANTFFILDRLSGFFGFSLFGG